MKKFYLSLLLMLMVGGAKAFAATASDTVLLFEFNDDTQKVEYLLDETPVLTYGESTLIVKTGTVEVSYERSNILKMTIDKKGAAGIEEVKADSEDTLVFEFTDNTVKVAGDQTITVFNLNGVLVKQGVGEVSLQDQPDGVYIANVKNHAVKVLKK